MSVQDDLKTEHAWSPYRPQIITDKCTVIIQEYSTVFFLATAWHFFNLLVTNAFLCYLLSSSVFTVDVVCVYGYACANIS
jgi:hypothetical protein